MNRIIEDEYYVYNFDEGSIVNKKNNYTYTTRFINKNKANKHCYVFRELYEKFHNINLTKSHIISHIDNDKNNNKIDNLKLINWAHFIQENSKVKNNNITKHKNIVLAQGRYYRIIIGKIGYGYFKTIEDAIKHRNEILLKLNQEQNCHFKIPLD